MLIDSSYSIFYSASDLCNNISESINLIVNFVNIPIVELSGSAITNINIF